MLSPWFRTKICPPLAAWTILTGFSPTHAVFPTDPVAVTMLLTDPVVRQAELKPELSTYMLLLLVDVRKMGCDPDSSPTVVTAPLM